MSSSKSTSNTTNTGMLPPDDWRYRYNPSGECEGRRLYNDMNDDGISPYPWTYYLLDGRSRQFSVWNGQQTSDPTLCPTTPIAPGTSTRFMYPTEYLAYGVGSSADVVIAPDATKTYKVSDHLGSTRAEIVEGGITQNWDYEPYGGAVTGDPPRKGFIDREEDKESALGDFGVRKYDEDIGRFLSTDPLWEKYRGWSPYQYGANNPTRLIDPSGKSAVGVLDVDESGNPIVRVEAHIVFYGAEAVSNEDELRRLIVSLNNEYNAAGAIVRISGIDRQVVFNITTRIAPDDATLRSDIASESDLRVNYIRVDNEPDAVVSGSDGRIIPGDAININPSNSGRWNLGNNLEESMTGAHEIGHLFGLHHYSWDGIGDPDVMSNRHSTVTHGRVPGDRVVTAVNVHNIFNHILFVGGAVEADIGTIDHNYHAP